MILGINASRAKSGGGIVHLKKILEHYSFSQNKFTKIHIWGYENILNQIPSNKIFYKHIAFSSNRSLFYQIFWEKYKLPIQLKKNNCNILINLDAGSFCRFLPNITMSRDMLSYEPGIMNKYFFSILWLRLFALKYVQVWSLRSATKSVFLTKYAKNIIEKFSGKLSNSVMIPHGVDFIDPKKLKKIKIFNKKYIEIVYVSNFDLYKHQDNVIIAFNSLIKKHNNLRLHLVGGYNYDSFYKKCKKLSKNNKRIVFHGNVLHSNISNYLYSADVLLFASSCENMPNTLLEYMTSKKPILCSEKGPMPEVLGEWDFYFDPENVSSVKNAMSDLILQRSIWPDLSLKAYERAKKYSWKKCSKSIFDLSFKILK